MAARAYWSGRIRFALVSIPVEIVPATKSAARIAFHQIHEPSGKRIRYEKVVPGIGPVDTDEIVKGYEVEKGKYVLLTDEEIDEVKLEAKKTIDLVQFVDADAIDPIYFERPYFVLPRMRTRTASKPMRVLRDALKKTKKVGLGQIVGARPGLDRGDQALRQGPADGDTALRGRGARRPAARSTTSRRRSPRRI